MEEWASFMKSLSHKYGEQQQEEGAASDQDSVDDSCRECGEESTEQGTAATFNATQDDPSSVFGACPPCHNHQDGQTVSENQQQAEHPSSPTSVLRANQCTASSKDLPPSSQQQWSKWNAMNKMLADCGFPPVELPLSDDQLYDTLLALVRDYGRREELVQELLQEVDELRRTEEHHDAQASKLEDEAQLWRRRFAMLEQNSEMALSAAERANMGLRKEVQALEASTLNLQQRCRQLEHNCRAKERAAEKYQHKLLEVVEKLQEESQRSRDVESYRSLRSKVVKARREQQRDNLDWGRDVRPAQLVGYYEKQKAAMASELGTLRSQVARLANELQSKENIVVGSGTGHVHLSLLEQLCTKLDVKSPIQMPDALDALLKVNAAVPRLEEFVEDVCNVVLVSGKDFLPRANMQNPREVPELLRGWLDMLSARKSEQTSQDIPA